MIHALLNAFKRNEKGSQNFHLLFKQCVAKVYCCAAAECTSSQLQAVGRTSSGRWAWHWLSRQRGQRDRQMCKKKKEEEVRPELGSLHFKWSLWALVGLLTFSICILQKEEDAEEAVRGEGAGLEAQGEVEEEREGQQQLANIENSGTFCY